jgi:hypothetical protein
MEKKVLAHAAGEVDDMRASFVSVTTNGLLAAPLAPTVRAVVRVCELPLVAVAKFQVTPLVVVLHPVWAVVSALVVKPPACVELVGRFTAEIVTGYELVLAIVTTTSPVPPGNSTLPGAGEATAVMLRLAMVADCPSPDEPLLRPTTQLVAA